MYFRTIILSQTNKNLTKQFFLMFNAFFFSLQIILNSDTRTHDLSKPPTLNLRWPNAEENFTPEWVCNLFGVVAGKQAV